MSQPLAAGRGHPRCSATLQAGANGTFRQRQRQKCSGADDVPGVRRTSYYLELQQQDGIFGEQKPPYLEKAGVDDLRTFGPWRREAYEICAGSPELPAKRPERLAAYTNWLAKPAKPAQVIDVTAMTAGCVARRMQSPKRSWLRRRRRCPARQRVPAWIVPTSQNAQNTRKIGFGIVLGEEHGRTDFYQCVCDLCLEYLQSPWATWRPEGWMPSMICSSTPLLSLKTGPHQSWWLASSWWPTGGAVVYHGLYALNSPSGFSGEGREGRRNEGLNAQTEEEVEATLWGWGEARGPAAEVARF